MKQILISGGSGLVGSCLTELLLANGYAVAHLSSRKNATHKRAKVYYWNISEQYIDLEAFKDTFAVIHLAGASVAGKKWTKARKKEIYESRILSTRLLYNSIKNTPNKITNFISTSATGFYGADTNDVLTEESENGADFLAKVCHDWEEEALKIEQLDINVAIVRIGIVLSKDGGAFREMLQTFPFFGTKIGNGKQVYPWIHIDDLCRMFLFLLENKLKGIFNATAPHPVAQKEIVKVIKQVKYSLAPIVPTPLFVLKMVLGEMVEAIVSSQNCSNQKIVTAGFEFEYSDIKSAVKSIL